MNRINKPNKVVPIGGDWSWKEPVVAQPRKRNKKKKAEKKHKKLITIARKNGHAALIHLGKPPEHELSNMKLAARLLEEGLLKDGPFNKTESIDALIAWYRALDIKYYPRNKTGRKNKKSSYAKTDNFLKSWEWNELRYKALKLHGRKCQCCGAQPPEIVLHVDHIKPRSKFPELALDLDNLQVLCEWCNKGKSNKHEDDFR